MKRDSRLSNVLHALLHMAEMEGPATSEAMAQAMQTNPVVVRRLMAGLRYAGFVSSAKGHGGHCAQRRGQRVADRARDSVTQKSSQIRL